MKFSIRHLQISILLFCLPVIGWTQAQTPVKDTSKPATVIAIPPPPPDTNIRIFESPVVSRTVQKVEDYHRLSHGVSPGFRVQIDFGQDRSSVSKTKSDFSLKYPSIPSYLTYKPPYFKICVGDFRTKLEAVHFLNIVKKDYKGSFVVIDKINPPPLN